MMEWVALSAGRCGSEYVEYSTTDFEDAIRNAISIGGDSDTIVAITASIAEAAYGISEDIKEKALSYLDEPLKDVLRRWKKYMRGDKS